MVEAGIMHGLYREDRHPGSSPISQDLAKHLYTRMLCGKVAIVTEKPGTMLAAVRKQWMNVERRIRRERSSTLDARKILELTYQLPRFQTLVFTAKRPLEEPRADVQFATIEDFLEWPPQCRTLYVACPIKLEQLHMVTSWMPPHSLVVVYEAT